MKAPSAFLFLVIIVTMHAGSLYGQEKKDKAPEPFALVFLDVNSEMALGVVYKNDSDKEFRYFSFRDDKRPFYWFLTLYKDGKLIVPAFTPLYPNPSKDNVRTLKPGESVVRTLKLKEYYREKDLTPGRYELKSEYEIDEKHVWVKEFGITPARVNKTLLYIEIK